MRNGLKRNSNFRFHLLISLIEVPRGTSFFRHLTIIDVMKSFVILVVIFSSNLIYGQSIVNPDKVWHTVRSQWNWVSEDLSYFSLKNL